MKNDFFILIAMFASHGMRGCDTLVDAEQGSAPFCNFAGGDDHSNLRFPDGVMLPHIFG